MKKLLSALICVLIVISTLSVSTFAADYQYELYFDDSGVGVGISGKSADDKSCNVKTDKYNIIQLKEKITLEYNLFSSNKDWHDHLRFVYTTATANNVLTKILGTRNNGKIVFFPDASKAYDIPSGRWSRIALEFDPTVAENNLSFYINGTLIATSSIVMPKNSVTYLRAIFDLSKDYIDDVVVYYGDYRAPSAPSLSGKKGTLVNGTDVTLPYEAGLDDLSEYISVSEGTLKGIVDQTTNLTKTEGDISTGDKLVVAASDGFSYSYYNVTVAEKVDNTPVLTMNFNDTGAVSGVAGKTSDDKSCNVKTDKYNVIQLKHKVTLEYNLFNSNKDYNNHLSFVYTTATANNVTTKIFGTRSNGKIVFFPDASKAYDIPVGRWSRIAITFDPNSSENNLIFYMNGKVVSTASIVVPLNDITNLRTVFDMSKNYIDDVSVYYGDYTYPSVPEATALNGSSISDGKVNLPAGTKVSEINEYVSVSNGSVLGISAKDTFLTKIDGFVSNGDEIVLTAPDGVTYTYLKASVVETESFFNDFSGMTPSANDGDWIRQPGGFEYLCPGYEASGIGGKSEDDKCVDLQSESAYYRLDKKIYGITTFEFSILKKNTTNCFMGADGYNTWLLFGKSGNIYDSGSLVQEDENVVGSYKVGQWIRAAIEINFKNSTFNAYVNGEKLISDKQLPTQVVEGNNIKWIFKGRCYVDDIKVYSGTYEGGTAPSLESGENYTINPDGGFLVTDETYDVSDISNVFGDSAVVSDSQTFVTKTEGTVEVGDFISVCSDDGLIRTYYTVVSPDYLSDIEIYKDGKICNDTVPSAGSYKAKISITSSNPVSYKLYIAKYNGSKLTGIDFVNINNGFGRYIDGEYFTEEISVASGESVKAFLWTNSDLKPVKSKKLMAF